jgi:hypothetical protein
MRRLMHADEGYNFAQIQVKGGLMNIKIENYQIGQTSWVFSALWVFSAFALLFWLIAAPAADALDQDLWGFEPTKTGGLARSCTGPNDDKACVVVFCRNDGQSWLGLQSPPNISLFDDQAGSVIFGDEIQHVTWALVEGPYIGTPLWVADIVDIAVVLEKLAIAGKMSLALGSDESNRFEFGMASSQLAFSLLKLRCDRLAAQQ